MGEKTVKHCRDKLARYIAVPSVRMINLYDCLRDLKGADIDDNANFIRYLEAASQTNRKIAEDIGKIIEYHEAYVRNKREMEQNG